METDPDSTIKRIRNVNVLVQNECLQPAIDNNQIRRVADKLRTECQAEFGTAWSLVVAERFARAAISECGGNPQRIEALSASYEAVVNASAQRGVRITELEFENATLRAQLAGKVSISCADAAAVLTAMKTTPAIVPSTAKPAMPSTALAHRKPQIGLRTL